MTPMTILALVGALLQLLQETRGLLDMDAPIELSRLGDAHRQALMDAADALGAQGAC